MKILKYLHSNIIKNKNFIRWEPNLNTYIKLLLILPLTSKTMSKYEPKSISPIKMLNTSKQFETPKAYETPAKYLTQRIQTIYEEQYYKEKSQRLQIVVKQLKQEIRILQTQNKQLKTQIQIYRDSKGAPPSTITYGSGERKQQIQKDPEDVQRLLKEIRILKNSHETELAQSKNQQKRLNKKIIQLQDQLHQSQVSWQSKSQQNQGKIQQRNKQLEKQIKELRKSIVDFMEKRDQNQQKLQKIKILLQQKDNQVKEAQHREKTVMQEKVSLEQKLNQYLRKGQEANKKDTDYLKDVMEESQDWEIKNYQQKSRRRQELYQFGVNSIRRNPNKESHFSVHTFNGTGHVPAEQAFQAIESFKSQIHRLQADIQRNSILHVKQKDDLSYIIEKYQKELKEKDNDIVNLLTKVKPLMVQRNKAQGKQNDQSKKDKFLEEKESTGRNAFGIRMLEMFLKKYKMEAF